MLSHRHADRQDGWQLWKRVSNGKNAVSWLLQIIAAGGRTHSLEARFIGRCYCGARMIWVWRLTLLSSRTAHGFRLKNYLTRSEEAYQNWRSALFPYLCCSRRTQPVRTGLAREMSASSCTSSPFAPGYLSFHSVCLPGLQRKLWVKLLHLWSLGTVTLDATLPYGSPGRVYSWDLRNRPISIDHLKILLGSWIRQLWQGP